MRVQDEEVLVSIEYFIKNLVATGMKLEELPLLFKKMKDCMEEILEEPEFDQTS